jgi:hypothetical protein
LNQEIQIIEKDDIKSKIYTIRNVQVMLDRDLAELYGVETRVLNQAVKRNIKKFPIEFMFQLTESDIKDWMSQIVISNKEKMGLRKMPYAFTEQGVVMLASVLRSDIAVQISIKIVKSFIQMRKFIANNVEIFFRLDRIENKQLITDEKLEKVIEVIEEIESKDISPKQGIFFDGQIFDAYSFVTGIIKSAKTSIILIDSYIDESVLLMLSKRAQSVNTIIYTSKLTKQLQLDIDKFNKQYEAIEIIEFHKSHDRFLIIDDATVYHIGASLKDLGKKWFAFSKINIDAIQMKNMLVS